jgi:xylulose-5-phosphate/fructose-6-phosphate phosphoketolase
MPGEVIDRPNPGPLPSHLPPEVDGLLVKLDKVQLAKDIKNALRQWQRAANYIAAGIILPMVLLTALTLLSDDLSTE